MSAPAWASVDAARAASGLRLVLGRAIPGPWSVAARAIFELKGIPYIAVPHDAGMPNDEVREWTGQASAPIAVLDNDRPRANWSEILLLAETLQPEPPLIPADPRQRMEMFGLAHEICAEDGLGWVLRALLFAMQAEAGSLAMPTLLAKYGSRHTIAHYSRRLNEVIGLLAELLTAQKCVGSRYFVGDRLSAADIYWAAFSNLLHPMAPEACIMPDFVREIPAQIAPHLLAPLSPALIAHRDYVVDTYIQTPICM
ncbi:MAG: hypothetical protein WCZ66_08130 [Sphingomonadaceae bacterium]